MRIPAVKHRHAALTCPRLANGIAAISLDAGLTVLDADEGWYGLFRISPASFARQGRSLRRVLPSELGDILYETLRGEFPRHTTFQWNFPRSGDVPLCLHVTALAAENAEPATEHVYHLIATDITEITCTRRNAAFADWKYDVVSEISKDIFFEYDYAEDTLTYAEKYRTLFDDGPAFPHFRRDAAADPMADLLMAAAQCARCDSRAVRLKTRDGDIHLFSVFCTVIRNAEGAPLKAIGVLRDVDRDWEPDDLSPESAPGRHGAEKPEAPRRGRSECRGEGGGATVPQPERDEHTARPNTDCAGDYAEALHRIYDELYEINATRGTYRRVRHLPGKYADLPESGPLRAGLTMFSGDVVHPEDRERFLRFSDPETVRAAFAAGRESEIGEFRIRRRDGGFQWVSITILPVWRPSGEDKKFLCFIMDIAAKRRAEDRARQHVRLERRRLREERYKAVVEQTDALVFEWCREPEFRHISPEIPRRFAGDYDDRDIMEIWLDDGVVLPQDRPQFKAFLEDINSGGPYAEMTVRFRKRDDTEIWCRVAVTCRRNRTGELVRLIGTLTDVDAAARSLEALKYRTEFDTLTGLHNMQSFYARSAEALRRYPDKQYSIIRMDIRRFKVVNDLYGIEEGDKLLRHIGDLLRERVSPWEICGRLGGDVFCACVAHTETQILIFMHSIREKLADYPLPHNIAISFGICKVDDRNTPVSVLCDWAHLALKTIKDSYIRHYAFYDEKLREKILEEKTIESAMHDALLHGQFVLYLQPKVDIATSRIVGAECLVRWRHADGDVMPPEKFISQFEKNGFIIKLDEYVWEEACRLLRAWIDAEKAPVPLSVNVSRMHIHDTRFCKKLLNLSCKYSLDPRLLELELTENAFLENAAELHEAMRTLRHYGFLFSMDDFGTGYSSLNMLKSLPIDSIKIDRGFFDEDVSTERGKIVIRHTIAMATRMRMNIVAEGVENVRQAAFLLEAGCRTAQGYYYSPPLPPPDFEQLAFSLATPFPVAAEIARLISPDI